MLLFDSLSNGTPCITSLFDNTEVLQTRGLPQQGLQNDAIKIA